MSEAIKLLWAKSPPFMSLSKHSLCVGLCTEEYLNAVSSRKILNYLSNCFQLAPTDTISLISYLAAVHDIGKVHPAFQKKDKECYQHLVDSDQDFTTEQTIEMPIPHFRHEHYSAVVLGRIWKSMGLGVYERKLLSEILSLHHQKPGNRLSKMEPHNSLWQTLQNELELYLRTVFLKNAPIQVPDVYTELSSSVPTHVVCPTHVGMNRAGMTPHSHKGCLPHACGDEPWIKRTFPAVSDVCPTHVGMNRIWWRFHLRKSCLPHACEDEPSGQIWTQAMQNVCPTHVGMNRASACRRSLRTSSAPRMWG